MANKQAIKSRIRSIKSTKKITKAMEMIANAKLARLRKRMEINRTYALQLSDLVNDILLKQQNLKSIYLLENNNTKTYTILFTSDLGLCGGYNTNIVKLVKEKVNVADPLLLIGTSHYDYFKHNNYNLVNHKPIMSDNLDEVTLARELEEACALYLKGEVGKVQIAYTAFINTVTFNAQIKTLLPFIKPQAEEVDELSEIIFDPSKEVVLDSLIEQTIRNLAYAISLESRTAEQASRRLAMETASDNADDLENQLVLEYNRARQSAITQEITEIVAAASAV